MRILPLLFPVSVGCQQVLIFQSLFPSSHGLLPIVSVSVSVQISLLYKDISHIGLRAYPNLNLIPFVKILFQNKVTLTASRWS